MSPDTAVQIALRGRFIASTGLLALVPAANVIDRNARPIVFPSIVIGESQMVDEGTTIARTRWRVYSTLHLWKREEGLTGVKAIAWEIHLALRNVRLDLGNDFHCVDSRISSQRFMRDLDGETAHGVVTIDTLLEVL